MTTPTAFERCEIIAKAIRRERPDVNVRAVKYRGDAQVCIFHRTCVGRWADIGIDDPEPGEAWGAMAYLLVDRRDDIAQSYDLIPETLPEAIERCIAWCGYDEPRDDHIDGVFERWAGVLERL